MLIDEAIEILTILEARSINNSTMFKKDALQLGLEALKFVAQWNKIQLPQHQIHLPRETDE